MIQHQRGDKMTSSAYPQRNGKRDCQQKPSDSWWKWQNRKQALLPCWITPSVPRSRRFNSPKNRCMSQAYSDKQPDLEWIPGHHRWERKFRLNIQVGTQNSNRGYTQEDVDQIIRGTCPLKSVMEMKMRTAVKCCWTADTPKPIRLMPGSE